MLVATVILSWYCESLRGRRTVARPTGSEQPFRRLRTSQPCCSEDGGHVIGAFKENARIRLSPFVSLRMYAVEMVTDKGPNAKRRKHRWLSSQP
ncbi:hypothetical protein CPSG_08049 [Coccidioides posadasii str. Silveira]|uniref:Uncharacterized protein n=1 Tax=Coccidioides posadasii (strain RMSCC 757 / Silveira) TaxID=443226 RepID=E9DD87_COCPS|nr:hypothetical protein CPSG_08049 [Coccidioides posadasii str. Silveira]